MIVLWDEKPTLDNCAPVAHRRRWHTILELVDNGGEAWELELHAICPPLPCPCQHHHPLPRTWSTSSLSNVIIIFAFVIGTVSTPILWVNFRRKNCHLPAFGSRSGKCKQGRGIASYSFHMFKLFWTIKICPGWQGRSGKVKILPRMRPTRKKNNAKLLALDPEPSACPQCPVEFFRVVVLRTISLL